MAKRQSLKELQERLAQRLSVARSEAVAATWLAIESGGRRFLLPLVQSGEIFPVAPVQRVPYTKGWFVGVANLRGGLNGVVDLAQLMGLAAPADGSAWTTAGCDIVNIRGNDWGEAPVFSRSGKRNATYTDTRGDWIGFRVARDL